MRGSLDESSDYETFIGTLWDDGQARLHRSIHDSIAPFTQFAALAYSSVRSLPCSWEIENYLPGSPAVLLWIIDTYHPLALVSIFFHNLGSTVSKRRANVRDLT